MGVSGAGARAKGARAESEFVAICNENGLPAQKVLASGSFVGAKGDLKLGVTLNSDGTFPATDESQSKMRVEVKNRKDNPEFLFNGVKHEVFALIDCGRTGNEAIWSYLNQDAVTKGIVLRRGKVPVGALKNKDYNQVYMVAMGLNDFIALFKKAYPDVCK